MKQADFDRLARQFTRAIKVRPGDHVWVEYLGSVAKKLADTLASHIDALGGFPLLVDNSAAFINHYIGAMSVDEIAAWGRKKLAAMQGMQCYIRISDDADKAKVKLPDDKDMALKTAVRLFTDYRINNTRWLVVAAPTQEFAAACNMSLRKFEKFYLQVNLVDYETMTEAVKPLEKLMTDGKTVRIASANQETDLHFSIAGIPAIPCTGSINIPDGECFTAPVRDLINGTIKFGPSNYDGQRFPWIKLKFEHGKIVDAQSSTAERTAALNKILDTDEGARYTGEFAINFNPYIKHPTGNILFDEKIDGGVHIAMGMCYDTAPNGNKSKVHWDMVHIQRPDYGGGELYIDDRLIRKDGIFVVPELLALNPENLMGVSKKLGS